MARTMLFAAAAALAAGCGGNSDAPTDVVTGPTHVRVIGTVTRGNGAKLSGATAIVQVGEAGAGRTCVIRFSENATTDLAGDYGVTVLTGSLSGLACVMVEIRPPAGTDLRAREVRGPDIAFGSTSAAAPVVRVDVVLESASPF